MDRKELDKSILSNALREVGERLSGDHIEILIVGGAAGMLTGQLGPERTTGDCDVIWSDPASALERLELIADEVGDELGLERGWLNSDVFLSRNKLPRDWRERWQIIGHYGGLVVWAISRVDLICMKLAAGRDQDQQDLLALGIEEHEAGTARAYLERLQRELGEEQDLDEEKRKKRQEDIDKGVRILAALTAS